MATHKEVIDRLAEENLLQFVTPDVKRMWRRVWRETPDDEFEALWAAIMDRKQQEPN
jgi:hypothetical protein